MPLQNTSEKWIESGYELFAKEGPDGIQVERLARIVNLNKSGFYHYFGDMENFSKQLLRHHHRMFDLFLADVGQCKNIDPDYIHVLLKHSYTFMAQIYLVRNKTNQFFFDAHKELDDKIGKAILGLWIDHTGIHNDPTLAYQYHSLVRDMVYSRVDWKNLSYDYLHTLSEESKELVKRMFVEGGQHVAKNNESFGNLNGIVYAESMKKNFIK